MGWRSVMITQPAYLSLTDHALQIRQGEQQAKVPLEDVSVLLIDNPQVTLTAQLLSACAEHQIAVLTVGSDHHPNGVYLPFLPHSRLLKVMRAQLALKLPLKKQLHQRLIQQKISNQGAVLASIACHAEANFLQSQAERVRSGDPDNLEAVAAQRYFQAAFGDDFTRNQSSLINSALNYGYAVLRAAVARALVAYGFLPAFGLFHRSEQNAFNLADDLMEPYRPYIDSLILTMNTDRQDDALCRDDKAALVSILHKDVVLSAHKGGSCTLLAAIEESIMSLGRIIQRQGDADALSLPILAAK